MPSSSGHGSKGEEQLILLYRLIFLHFWFSGMKKSARRTTAYFEELLDFPGDETYRLINSITDEPEWMEQWKEFIENTKTSVNLWAAVAYMCDCAHVLRNLGRVKEADAFLPWIEETQTRAKEVEHQGREWSDSDYHHHGG